MKDTAKSVLLYDHKFCEDKEENYSPAFQVYSMSPHSDHLGMVQSGAFAVSFPGNWHCLHAEEVTDFQLELVLKENLIKKPTFLIYFHGKKQGTKALYLELNFNGELYFGLLEDVHYQVLKQKKLKAISFGTWSIDVKNDKVQIVCNGKSMAVFTIPSSMPRKGIIALDGAVSAYGARECRIDSLKLSLPPKKEKSLPTLKIPMIYGPNGVATPYTYTLERTSLYGCEKWHLTLEGGPGKAEDYPEPRCMNAEKMINPYCRALDKEGNELFKVLIANGKAGSFSVLRATYGIPEFVFPLSRDIVVDTKNVANLAFGYEYYESEAVNSLAGGPAEIVCDLKGKVLSFQKVYENGKYDLKLESPKDKEITRRLPKDIPDYKNALAYAQVNHYFVEGEEVRFRGISLPLEATEGEFVLEDAYRKKIRSFRKKAGEFFTLGVLPPGVYHLSAKLKRNDFLLGEIRNAFEVIPDEEGLSAQKIAGYPDLYPDTFLADYSHHFHPWGTEVVDVSHYIGFGPELTYTTDRRRMKLLKLYHRDWFSHCRPSFATRECCEYVKKHASIVQMGDFAGRLYLHMPSTYESDWMKARTKEFAGKELTFEEIYPARWSEFLDFIAPHCAQVFKEHHTLPNGHKTADFLAAATYGSIYKGPNYTRLMGMDLRNGSYGDVLAFSVMEDYPYSSRYPLSRSTYQFTALTMEDPTLRHLPQVWGLNAETLDSRVVYGHPPYGISVTPPKFLYTRFMELMYGTAFFDGEKFAYWQGNGFLHSSSWTKEMFDEFVSLSGTYHKLKAVSPLRSPAFVYSRAACDAHPYFYEKNERFIRGGSMVNTAEEFGGYMYEMARKEGLAHGFQTRMEFLKNLSEKQVSLLVLPPLQGVPEEELAEIRRLHKKGVNLLCSEDAASLQDLFDVDHAQLLLERKGEKLLTLKKNGKAFAAFFTIAPSMQQRGRDRTGGSGQKALDPEINAAARNIMRLLGDYEVMANNGAAVTPFQGSDGHTYTFVQENSWPDHGGNIQTDVYYKGKVVTTVALERHESKLIQLD